MADLVIVAANVKPVGTPTVERVTLGETITQGLPVYLNTNDNEYYRADANDGAAKAVVAGLLLTPAGDGESAYLLKEGEINLGVALTVGAVYVLSDDRGICPDADAASTHYKTVIGVAKTAAILAVQIHASGAPKSPDPMLDDHDHYFEFAYGPGDPTPPVDPPDGPCGGVSYTIEIWPITMAELLEEEKAFGTLAIDWDRLVELPAQSRRRA